MMRLRFVVSLSLFLTACSHVTGTLAPNIAEPRTRPARNFTSFDGALRCMDDLLVRAKRPKIFLSSTGVVDHTKRINVAGDDMLINALVRMTEQSRAYVFLDQGLVSAQGLIDLLVVQKEDTPRPDYYVRGAISQFDSDVAENDVSVSGDDLKTPTGPGLDRLTLGHKDSFSVVSVDLHLVGYPSRQIVPGASVSNAMVVKENRRDFSSFGIIALTGLNTSVQVDRLESTGQAVRNLIEVSLIELVGKHRNVPYWECLAAPSTDAQANSVAEQRFVALGEEKRIEMAQRYLVTLGLLTSPKFGHLTNSTKAALATFQAQENLLVNGIVDFDTFTRLKQRTEQRNAPRVAKPAPIPPNVATPKDKQRSQNRQSTANSAGTAPGDSLRELLPPSEQRTERRDRGDGSFQSLGKFLDDK